MKKKLILAISALAVGIALLVLSLISGVSLIWKDKKISAVPDGRYEVWARATIQTRGIFTLKEAKVTFKVVDADNNLLLEKPVWTAEEKVTFKELFPVKFLDVIPPEDAIPEDVIMEISDAKFDNGWLTAISSIIIVFSSVAMCFLIKKWYNERKTG